MMDFTVTWYLHYLYSVMTLITNRLFILINNEYMNPNPLSRNIALGSDKHTLLLYGFS
jgi:hypothetical protein